MTRGNSARSWRQAAPLFAAPGGETRPRGVPKAASAIVPASFLRLC